MDESTLFKIEENNTVNLVTPVIATPFVKWIGGKRQLLPEISKRLPVGLGKTIKRYAEPFVGGGAVLFHILQNYEISEAYISDKNYALITSYQIIKTKPETLIRALQMIQSEYMSLLTHEERTLYYNRRRVEFNQLTTRNLAGEQLSEAENLRVSSFFIFLNKTCFNGLYRENAKGEFNASHGKYDNPLIVDKNNILAVNKVLQNTQILFGDYSKVSDFVDENTFLYVDPPYRPLNTTSNFTRYVKGGFGDDKQIELANLLKEYHTQNHTLIMLSNSDPHNSDENDNFFDDLYNWGTINRIQANRVVNTKGDSRGAISEILFTSY